MHFSDKEILRPQVKSAAKVDPCFQSLTRDQAWFNCAERPDSLQKNAYQVVSLFD